MVPLLSDRAEVVVPDMRGFGESDKHDEPLLEAYSRDAQARSVLRLVDELGLERPVIAGYDVGSRLAQVIAGSEPDAARALVITPPVPGAGERVLTPEIVPEFWYQTFHTLELPEQLIDGRPDAVRAYLEYIWSHWSGPDYTLDEASLDHLVEVYSAPGAFTASIAWYRTRSSTLALAGSEHPPAPEDRFQPPTTVVWPAHDPLFPQSWSDRLDQWFSDVDLRLLDRAGHFVPLEAPEVFASAILERL
jgi:pimeloyl-ACP methyl ester carboxylesterase